MPTTYNDMALILISWISESRFLYPLSLLTVAVVFNKTVNTVNASYYIVCLTMKDKGSVIIPYISTDVDLDIEG